MATSSRKLKKLSSLSIFFPCYYDAKIIPYLITKASLVAQQVSDDYEVIVIDDGSPDDSYEVLESLKKNLPFLRVVHHQKNQGYGAALISGFTAAKKDWVFYTDGDGQYDPTELIKLIKKLGPSVDVVNGYKRQRQDMFIRRVLGSYYNARMVKKYHLPISDLDCDFRLIKNSALKKIHLESLSGNICLELILKLKKSGARFAEAEVNHYPRVFGRSQFFTLKNLLKTVKEHYRVKV